MTDNTKRLSERLRQIAESQRMDFDSLHVAMTLEEAADALEASAPAVDREALVEWFRWHADPNEVADNLLASGILRDVRDVQAETLEQAASEMYGRAVVIGGTPGWLRARAQAIREARQ